MLRPEVCQKEKSGGLSGAIESPPLPLDFSVVGTGSVRRRRLWFADKWSECCLDSREDIVEIPGTFGLDLTDHFRPIVQSDTVPGRADDLAVDPAGLCTRQVDHGWRDILGLEIRPPIDVRTWYGAYHTCGGDWRDAVRGHSIIL